MGIAFSLFVLGVCLAPASAVAAAEHPLLGSFCEPSGIGSAPCEPSFLGPQALAVDQASGDVYVADVGVNEVQSVKVSATGGQFKLCFKGECTGDLFSETEAEFVSSELRAIASINGPYVRVNGGPGDGVGSTPYVVTFVSVLATTDVPQLECINGTNPLGGGSGCSVATTTPGIASKVKRFHADGTPDNFSALGSNVIDNLVFPADPGEAQIAVDNSGGVADGDIYVTQAVKHLVDVFASTGTLLGQLTESSEGAFGEPCGVGVDEGGALYVGDFPGHVRKYEPSANPVVKADSKANFSFSLPCNLAAGAGPSNGAIFADRFSGELFKLNSSTGEIDYPITEGVTTVTVDPSTGHLYVAKGSEVIEYDASGTTPTVVSTISLPSKVQGIAVDAASGNLYVDRAGSSQLEVFGPLPSLPEAVTGAPSGITPTEATFNGTVDPNGAPLKADPEEGCFFAWGENESYGNVAPCEEPDAEEVGEGNSPVAVHAKLLGLRVGTTYHYRLVAATEEGFEEGDDEELLTLGPSVRGASATQITASGARISGEVNPRGKETSFEVQYVTEAQFDLSEFAEAQRAPVPARKVGSGSEFKEVSQQLLGLVPATTYHFRLVASSEVATNEGPDATPFTIFAQPPEILPDARAYEMVSPVQKAGGEVLPPLPVRNLNGSCNNCLPGISSQMTPMQSAPDGEAVVYEGQPFSENLAAGANEYLAGRSAGGWGTQSLSSPLFASGRGSGEGYQAISTDLSRAVLYQISPPLSPLAPMLGEESYPNLYLRDAAGALTPLVTEEPPNRQPRTIGNNFMIFYAAANAGAGGVPVFSHVAFEANDALTSATASAPAAVDGGVVVNGNGLPINLNLYEYFDGHLRLVNVAPDNKTTAPGAVIGSGRFLASNPQREAVAVDHAISDDGSRIFWSEEGSGQLYVRIDGEETRKVKDPGTFLTASADGSKVLLNDGCLYGLQEEECEEDLSDGKGGFRGMLGAAEDLSRIYFVDTKALTPPEEENANHEHAEDGEFNLYAWDTGETSFVAALSEEDNRLGAGNEYGDWKASRSQRTAQVSPDGRFLAFMSLARLTGYDNEVQSGGVCTTAICPEVFEYDGDSGALHCASCNPSGQRPLGPSNLSLIRGIPGFPPLRQPANLSADGQGRLFFESQDTLSVRDSNGSIQDVYEWEPNGVGSCKETNGCVFLISSGQSSNDSMFVDSASSGNDVFLITRERLLKRDEDQLLDLYDARSPHVPGESVGFPESESPPCGGEACKGPISIPPSQPGAGSPNFNGPGNPPRPRKPHKKKHHHKKHKRHHKRGAVG